jgi:hypothetical protein
MWLALLASVCLVGAAASAASAGQRTFWLSNESDEAIVQLAVSVAGQNDWLDVDQGVVLEAGYNFDVPFDDAEFGCSFDVYAKFVSGKEQLLSGVDVCGSEETWVEIYSD